MPTNTTTNRNASAPVNEWQKRELGCLWKREKKETRESYLTGTLNLKNLPGFPDQEVQVVIFKNKSKQKESHPDLRIFVSEKRDAAKTTAPAPKPVASDVSDLI